MLFRSWTRARLAPADTAVVVMVAVVAVVKAVVATVVAVAMVATVVVDATSTDPGFGRHHRPDEHLKALWGLFSWCLQGVVDASG